LPKETYEGFMEGKVEGEGIVNLHNWPRLIVSVKAYTGSYKFVLGA